MEAPGYARWFERLLAKLGIEVWIGDAAKIKTKRVRKQKTDRRPGCRTSTEAAAGRTFSSNPGYPIRRIGSAAIALASATTGADEDAVSSVGHAAPARFVGVAGRTRALIAREAFGFPRLATKLLTKPRLFGSISGFINSTMKLIVTILPRWQCLIAFNM
jgi:hypothetical protein